MEKRPSGLAAFFKIFRPWLVLAMLLTTVLGLGIAHHLAVTIDYAKAGLGFSLAFLLIESGAFLEAFYRHPSAPENRINHSAKVDDPYLAAAGQFQRPVLLYISLVLLGTAALVVTLMAIQGELSPAVDVLLGVGFLMSFFSSVPPLALSEKGYAEIVEAMLVTIFVPALTLALQLGELHILVLLLTLPLTLIYLALRIVISLEAYGRDSLLGRQVLLLRIGWQRGMNLHNYALIGSYLLLGVFFAFVLPWSLTWPYLLSIPFAIYQIVQMQQIANGARPNWRFLNLTAAATFAIASYMITITLWIR